jgi:hypothetical protein
MSDSGVSASLYDISCQLAKTPTMMALLAKPLMYRTQWTKVDDCPKASND